MHRHLLPGLRAFAAIPFAIPFAIVVFYIFESYFTAPDYFDPPWDEATMIAIGIFAIQFVLLAMVAVRYAPIEPLSSFLGQSEAATYVVMLNGLIAAAVAVRDPRLAVVWILAASIPLWLRNWAWPARIFWLIVTLPFTLYSLLASLFLVGIPTLPVAVAMWRSVRWHWSSDQVGPERTPRSALAAFVGAALLLTVVVAAISWLAASATAERYPNFVLEDLSIKRLFDS